MLLQNELVARRNHLLTQITWAQINALEELAEVDSATYYWHRNNITSPPVPFKSASKLATIFAAIDKGMGIREIAKHLNIYPSSLGPYIDKFYRRIPDDYEPYEPTGD